MREQLKGLHERAGRPSKGALRRHSEQFGHRVAESTLIGVPSGTGRLRWATVEAFVDGCLGYARNRTNSLLDTDHDKRRWQALFVEAYPEKPAVSPDEEVLNAYLARLCIRYRHLDINVLLPLDSQDEAVPISVREVFVPQSVRADPPPFELPREFQQRLAEKAPAEAANMPKGLDRDLLAAMQENFESQPARQVLSLLAEPTGRRMVVLGDPGSGKSTLARYLAVVLAQSDDGLPDGLSGLLPVLIELRAYAEPRWRDSTFLEFLDHQHRSDDGLGLPSALVEPLLREPDRVLIVFDGLDELFDPKARESVAHQITGFADRYPGARVLVTSRHLGYQRASFDSAGFSHHLLQNLDHDQISVFAERWYQQSCPDDPAEAARLRTRLLSAVNDSRAVRELAGNPLLLTILAIIGRRRELPRDRLTVYEHAVTVLVEQWEVKKALAEVAPGLPPLDRKDKLDLLRLIARDMQDAPAGLAGNYIAGPDLIAKFQAYLEESHSLAPGPARVAARAMLDQFRSRNFILSRYGGEVYGFVHRTFLEYLAAADLDDRFVNRDLDEDDLIQGVFGRRWRDPSWHEVLLLLTGMRERFAGKIIDCLLAADPHWAMRPDAIPHHLLLAIRCLGEVRKPGALGRRNLTVARMLTALLETVDKQWPNSRLPTAIREAVLPVAKGLGPRWPGRDHFLAWFENYLRVEIRNQSYSPRWNRRYSAETVALATRIGAALAPGEHFRVRTLTAVTFSADALARQSAITAVTEEWPDDPATVRWLRNVATSDPDPKVRRTAVEALAKGRPDDPDQPAWLRRIATADPDQDIRSVAITAFAEQAEDCPESLSWLRGRAGLEMDEQRVTAVTAIGRRWAGDPAVLSWLMECASTDYAEEVREAALDAVAASASEDPEVTSWIRRRAVDDSHETVRATALRYAAASAPEDAEIRAWLSYRAAVDHHELVRRTAVEVLARTGASDPETAAWLRRRGSADPDPKLRQSVVAALAPKASEDPVVAAWLRGTAIGDDDADVRRAAVEAVAEHQADASDCLRWLRGRAVTDDGAAVRSAALDASAAGWPDEPDAVWWLRERATVDSDAILRQRALEEVVKRGSDDPDILVWLHERSMLDTANLVREAAIMALASARGRYAERLSWLRERASNEPEWSVRRDAMKAVALTWRADEEAHSWFRQRASQDSDDDVRLTALTAVAAGWPDDPGTLPWLRERAVSDDVTQVRLAALEAIAVLGKEDPDTLGWLRKRVILSGDSDDRQAALKSAIAVGWPGDAGTVEWLRKRATTDSDATVRRTALAAVAAAGLDDAQVLWWLRDRAVNDESEIVRQEAIRTVAEATAGDAETLQWLGARATYDADEAARSVAVDAVAAGWPGDPDALALLRDRAVAESAWLVRQAALRAVVRGWPDAADALSWLRQRAAEDPHHALRVEALAAAAIGWPAHPDMLAWLWERAFQDPHWLVWREAIAAACVTRPYDPDALRRLRKIAVAVPIANDRAIAVRAIAAMSDRGADLLHWLMERAVEDDWPVRRTAVEVIAVGWADAPETLSWVRQRAVDDPDEDVRIMALRMVAARWHDDPETLPWLVERAATDEWTLRKAVVEVIAIGWAGDATATEWLRQRSVADPDEDVRQAAARALPRPAPAGPGVRDARPVVSGTAQLAVQDNAGTLLVPGEDPRKPKVVLPPAPRAPL